MRPRNSSSTPSITHKPSNHRGLQPAEYGYAVFGRVSEGMDVVDKIAAVGTQSQGPFNDVPIEPVLINSVTVQ